MILEGKSSRRKYHMKNFIIFVRQKFLTAASVKMVAFWV
jgi:hypothetical protein